MSNKPVSAIPGIGKVKADRFERQGVKKVSPIAYTIILYTDLVYSYPKATQVYGEYLVRDGNKASFKGYVQKQGANAGEQEKVYNAMKEWQDNHQ